IAVAFGGEVVRAPLPQHGKPSQVHHDGSALFVGIPTPFTAMRYHSLCVRDGALPEELRATAYSEDGVLMALEHRVHPVWGVQFHPESVGTPEGRQLLSNFLTLGQHWWANPPPPVPSPSAAPSFPPAPKG